MVKFEPEKPVFEEQSKVEKPFHKAEEISEVSNLSESVSTTIVTYKREEEEEVKN